MKPTVSARRVKALMEQITGTSSLLLLATLSLSTIAYLPVIILLRCIPDRYAHLPHLPHRLQFLLTIQLPLLSSYLSRISSSLDAYENLSSSLMRVVPGALAGQAGYTGVAERQKLTSGAEGLKRLWKACVSASWIRDAMEGWGEDLVSSVFFFPPFSLSSVL